MKRIITTYIVFLIINILTLVQIHAQEGIDSLFFSNGRIEAVNIKVNYSDRIEFCFPGEDILNIYEKSTLDKIVYRSGRVEFISHNTSVQQSNNRDRLEELRVHSYEGNLDILRFVYNTPVFVEFNIGTSTTKIDSTVLHQCSVQFCEGLNHYLRSSVSGKESTFVVPSDSDSDSHLRIEIHIISIDDDGEAYGILKVIDNETNAVRVSIYYNANGGNKETLRECIISGFNKGGKNIAKTYFQYFQLSNNIARNDDWMSNKDRIEKLKEYSKWQLDIYMSDFLDLLEKDIKNASGALGARSISNRFAFIRLYTKEVEPLSDRINRVFEELKQKLQNNSASQE